MTDTKPGVVLSWIFPEQTSGWFTYSVANMLRCDAQTHQYITGPQGDLITVSSGPRVAEARNQVVDSFAGLGADWLLMLDADMTFDAQLCNNLMEAAHPVARPIVGGLCFAGGKQNDPYPTIYRGVECQDKDGHGYINVERVYDYPRDSLVQCQATGGACLLVHRSVFAAMKDRYGTLPDGRTNNYPWFQEGVVGPNGEAWGEDINFCLRAGALGIPVHVHTGVKLGHVKTHLIDEVFYDNRRRAEELSAEGAFDSVTKPNRAQRRAYARRNGGSRVDA